MPAALLLAVVAGCSSVGPEPLLRAPAALAVPAVAPAVASPPVAAVSPPPPEAATAWDDRPGVAAREQMVAAAHPLATQAGLDVLRSGGSAVDAAVAVQAVLTLVEPQSSGIGGGLFLLVAEAGRVRALDGRETAPAAAGPTLFLRPDGQPLSFAEASASGLAVGVPGALRALEAAHREHGRLPWAALFEPARRLALQGFPIGPRLARLLLEPQAQLLRSDPEAAAIYFHPDGRPRAAGERLRNPALADTLAQVAAHGADALHTGPIAQDIVRAVRAHPRRPGLLSAGDLAGYRPRWREPLCTDYRRFQVCGMPPPSSGGVAVAQMLGLLEALDARGGPPLASLGPVPATFGPEPSALAVHRMAEAGRLAFADRARWLADPDFVPQPGGPTARALVDPAYLAGRAALVGERSMGRAAAGDPLPSVRTVALADDAGLAGGGTSQVSIVDRWGQAVSMTTTIESAFGARVSVRGFLLNHQLTDFSFRAEEGGRPVANRVAPGKRPRSSMAPTLVFERDPSAPHGRGPLVLVAGSPGGSSIPGYVLKLLVATLDWGLDAQAAVALPNAGSRNGPTELELGRSSAALVEALRARGHEVVQTPQTSGAQVIGRRLPPGGPAAADVRWFGGADPRREGRVAGD